MIEPNCDMPWEVYLDWLEDQGNADLRFIDPNCFILSYSMFISGKYILYHYENRRGYGQVADVMYDSSLMPVLSYRGEGGSCMGGFGDGWGNEENRGQGVIPNPLVMEIGDGEHD